MEVRLSDVGRDGIEAEILELNETAENLLESDNMVTAGVMHCDLAAFEASADGQNYCLVAAVPIKIDKESKLLPIFVPMPKKDAACPVTALKGQDRNLHQIAGSRIVRIQAAGGGESLIMLGEEHHLVVLSSSSTIFEWYSRANGWHSRGHCHRMLKQAHLDREWWSYACRFAGHMMREKVLGRDWTYPLFGQLVGIWKSHDKAQAKSLDDRDSVGYLLDIDIWQSGTTRIMQDGIVVKHEDRICSGTPYSVEPDATAKQIFVANMTHTSTNPPALRDIPDVTCPSDTPESERRKEVVHYEEIQGHPKSKKKNASDKKSKFTIKAKSIPVTPKTVATSTGQTRERWLVSIYIVTKRLRTSCRIWLSKMQIHHSLSNGKAWASGLYLVKWFSF